MAIGIKQDANHSLLYKDHLHPYRPSPLRSNNMQILLLLVMDSSHYSYGHKGSLTGEMWSSFQVWRIMLFFGIKIFYTKTKTGAPASPIFRKWISSLRVKNFIGILMIEMALWIFSTPLVPSRSTRRAVYSSQGGRYLVFFVWLTEEIPSQVHPSLLLSRLPHFFKGEKDIKRILNLLGSSEDLLCPFKL